jgi:signal transduction histidine kinase
MHSILARQLKRAGLSAGRAPDAGAWEPFLAAVSRAYEQAEHDRYLLERSLALSSEEMQDLHRQLASERDTISTVICSLGEGVCAVDQAGAVLFINPSARALLRIGPDEAVLGRPLAELARARTEQRDTLRAILADPPPPGEEWRLMVEGNDARFISFCAVPLGSPRWGLVLTLRDITDRKRLETEREELNRKLVGMSRQAGMAEIAAGVLHNVGNVLASVNISISVASELVQKSRGEGIGRLAALMESNRPRLAEFLSTDPAGVKVIDYLRQLGEQLAAERRAILEELTQLAARINHIGEIVATQQAYARAGGLKEVEQVPGLVEEALRITEAAMQRHNVRIVREFEPVPPVLVDRHHILQIVINILTNAKQAIQRGRPADRRIRVAIRPEGGDVLIEVEDTGAGIAPEHLTRIFSHGFTTRADGHGFGLHSAALAAREMGGSLMAHSDGPDRGACFTLRIPATPAAQRIAA